MHRHLLVAAVLVGMTTTAQADGLPGDEDLWPVKKLLRQPPPPTPTPTPPRVASPPPQSPAESEPAPAPDAAPPPPPGPWMEEAPLADAASLSASWARGLGLALVPGRAAAVASATVRVGETTLRLDDGVVVPIVVRASETWDCPRTLPGVVSGAPRMACAASGDPVGWAWIGEGTVEVSVHRAIDGQRVANQLALAQHGDPTALRPLARAEVPLSAGLDALLVVGVAAPDGSGHALQKGWLARVSAHVGGRLRALHEAGVPAAIRVATEGAVHGLPTAPAGFTLVDAHTDRAFGPAHLRPRAADHYLTRVGDPAGWHDTEVVSDVIGALDPRGRGLRVTAEVATDARPGFDAVRVASTVRIGPVEGGRSELEADHVVRVRARGGPGQVMALALPEGWRPVAATVEGHDVGFWGTDPLVVVLPRPLLEGAEADVVVRARARVDATSGGVGPVAVAPRVVGAHPAPLSLQVGAPAELTVVASGGTDVGERDGLRWVRSELARPVRPVVAAGRWATRRSGLLAVHLAPDEAEHRDGALAELTELRRRFALEPGPLVAVQGERGGDGVVSIQAVDLRGVRHLDAVSLARAVAAERWRGIGAHASDAWLGGALAELDVIRWLRATGGEAAARAHVEALRELWERTLPRGARASIDEPPCNPARARAAGAWGALVLDRLVRPQVPELDAAIASLAGPITTDEALSRIDPDGVATEALALLRGGVVPALDLTWSVSGGRVVGHLSTDLPFGTLSVPIRVRAGDEELDLVVVAVDGGAEWSTRALAAPWEVHVELDPDHTVIARGRRARRVRPPRAEDEGGPGVVVAAP